VSTVLRRRSLWTIAPAGAPVVFMGIMAAVSARAGIRGDSPPLEAVLATFLFASFAALPVWLIGRSLSVRIVPDGLLVWTMGRSELVRWMHLRLRKEDRGHMVLESAERTFPISLALYTEPAAAREFVLANLGLPPQPVSPPSAQTRRRWVALTAAVAIGLCLCALALNRSRPDPIRSGGPAPAIIAKDLISGIEVSLSPQDSERRAVVLSFWVVSCEHCTAQLIALDSVQSMARSNVRVVAIHLSSGDATAARRLVRRLKLGIETWQDVDRAAERRYGIQGTPATIVIDHTGCIRYFVTGTGGVEVGRLTRTALQAASDRLTSACS
jgi:peroxiredoxin